MRTLSILSPVCAALLASPLAAQKNYKYESVPGDQMEARIYTLDNGLKVYLSRNTDAPRVQTNIAVRAGSKYDPADATGLAHYLEHMLFKGTSHIGTTDWNKEAAVLAQISAAYEERRGVTDPAKRDDIYARIDQLSQQAAALAVPNEYDKMVKSLGARGTNAYTSTERTVYVNDVPSEEIERWMAIESERFRECVLRLFHTELETVYEEFNRAQDNDRRNAWYAMNRLLYQQHPYGTQTTLGSGEHLKDPSMVKIMDYFRTWYVPNNMALVLAGDIDYDRTIALADKYFGGWKQAKVPGFTFKPEDPIKEPRVEEVFGPMSEWVDLGWRFGGYGTTDPLMLDLISGMLSNGRAGLIDLDLVQDQKVLDASADADVQMDYSAFTMHGEPRSGQTLEQVRDLLLAQMDRLKRGDFGDWLMEAVVNNYRQRRMRSWSENNGARAGAMTDAFILRKSWKDVVDYYDRMGRITKQQVKDFAGKNFGAYACVFKRTGENRDTYKVSKPAITPLDIKRDGMSEWRKNWEQMPPAKLTPEFIDYATAIAESELRPGVPLSVVKNTTNELFSITYIVDMGTNNDRLLRLAVEYLPYLGTSRMPPKEFQKELFRLGLSLNVSAGEDRVYVSMGGLETNMSAGVDLLEYLLSGAQPNASALKELVNDILKERDNALKNKNVILQQAMYSYARYGPVSPFNDVLSTDELGAATSAELLDRIHGLMGYQHRIFYYGAKSPGEVTALLRNAHQIPEELKPVPPQRAYPEIDVTSNNVYIVDHDMVQAEMMLVSKAGDFDRELLPVSAIFNEYFGSGLSSIVFQEIRESKALAYSAYASFTTPRSKDEAHYVRCYLGTQADKLGDAVNALRELMNNMPRDERQFEGAKEAALKRIASDRITRERIFWSHDQLMRLGIEDDVRRFTYEAVSGLTLDQLAGFFDAWIKGRKYTYLVIGRKSGLDLKALGGLGPVSELTKQQIFGYGASAQP